MGDDVGDLQRAVRRRVYIEIELKQAERKGLPQNGSAARFSDMRLALFATEAAARAYVEGYE